MAKCVIKHKSGSSEAFTNFWNSQLKLSKPVQWFHHFKSLHQTQIIIITFRSVPLFLIMPDIFMWNWQNFKFLIIYFQDIKIVKLEVEVFFLYGLLWSIEYTRQSTLGFQTNKTSNYCYCCKYPETWHLPKQKSQRGKAGLLLHQKYLDLTLNQNICIQPDERTSFYSNFFPMYFKNN